MSASSSTTAARPVLPCDPVRGLVHGAAYSVPRSGAPVDLFLDGNEGPQPRGLELDPDPELLRRYPRTAALEQRLAARLGIAPGRLLLTAGADDALLRICTALLEPGRELVLPVPTFEMIPRYAALAGGTLREVDWSGDDWPLEGVLAAVNERTALVAVVSPNNPTGAVVTEDALRAVAAAAPGAWILVDEAYAEYADGGLTRAALELPNAILVRTFSKAFGLAGLRVGYAAGPEQAIGWLRRAGNPYPVAGPSAALALSRLDQEQQVLEAVARVRRERERLARLLEALGLRAQRSSANFVLARGRGRAADDPLWLRDALAGLGIAVRAFPGKARLEDALRITCPGDDGAFARLTEALVTVRAPERVVLDPALDLPAGRALPGLLRAIPEGSLARAWVVLPAAVPDAVGRARAARARGALVLALGPCPDPESLVRAGVARVLPDPDSLLLLLP